MRISVPVKIRFLALLLLFLAACAAPGQESAKSQASLSRLEAEEVFTTGFSSISGKYIEAHRLADVTLDGLKGFSTIDPALNAKHKDNKVILTLADEMIAAFPAPSNGNPEAWARLTVRASEAGRRASPEMAKADDEKIYEAVFDGILTNLDPFSRYATAKEARKNRAKREGFGGIGIRYRVRDGVVRITSVMPETPAALAGLLVGDVISLVDGEPFSKVDAEAVGERLRGQVNSMVRLGVTRAGHKTLLVFDIERGHIVPPTVSYSFKDGIGVFKISSFNQRTSRSLSRKMKKAVKKHGRAMKGIVLDLRGNPGGLLKQSIKVADLFLSQGQITETRGRHPDSIQHYDAGGRDMAQGRPVVVLVDGKSASASEIVASALQDRGRAIVIGTTSFGKGTVQTVVRLPNGGEMTLTWSRLATPSGYVLHELGVSPTLCTSGVTIRGPKSINRVLSRGFLSASGLNAWRTARFEDKARLKKLRESCPAERRRTPFEVEISRRLLIDPALYARAVHLAAPATAASE